ncbi:tyrosine-type recombinase/integrase [Massilia putida]|uniref:tyrosine-type recombinase/integrase n=1 Tax=Massilia putida TaxID=1141883 RepID=UPI00095315FA|nr:tyrosine-type recombinase/integrase [Massilia putida]
MNDPKQWDANPVASFDTFIQGPEFGRTSHRLGLTEPKPVSNKSAHIYRSMFGKFALWLARENKAFTRVVEQDLIRFISQNRAHGEQNSLISRRYLRLLERCYHHLQIRPNPATAALQVAGANGYIAQDHGMQVLDASDIAAFVNALPPLSPPGPNRAGRPPKAWKRRRDHAMQATMLFAGLRVAEAIGLRLSEVNDPFDGAFGDDGIVLALSPEGKHDTSHAHDTVLRAYGAQALRTWLREREALGVKGDLVFPGDLAGKPMSAVTVYRQVRATFGRAGIDVDHNGGRTLRNTFAVEELREGRTRGISRDSWAWRSNARRASTRSRKERHGNEGIGNLQHPGPGRPAGADTRATARAGRLRRRQGFRPGAARL